MTEHELTAVLQILDTFGTFGLLAIIAYKLQQRLRDCERKADRLQRELSRINRSKHLS